MKSNKILPIFENFIHYTKENKKSQEKMKGIKKMENNNIYEGLIKKIETEINNCKTFEDCKNARNELLKELCENKKELSDEENYDCEEHIYNLLIDKKLGKSGMLCIGKEKMVWERNRYGNYEVKYNPQPNKDCYCKVVPAWKLLSELLEV